MKLSLMGIKRYQMRLEGYGFVYRPVEQILKFCLWWFLMIGFSLYFEMHMFLFAILVLASVMIIPLCFLWQYEYLYEEKLFKEFTMMLQQLIASFKIHPKMNAAIDEVSNFCSEVLRSQLQEVLTSMEKGNDFASSMMLLEEAYPFFVLENLSCLMVMVEKFGARKYHEGLDLIQDDLDSVIEDLYMHQQELIQTKNKVFVLCILALFVGVMSKQMLQDLFVFSTHIGYQLALFTFVVSLIVSLVMAQMSLRHTWLVWEKDHG